MTASATIQTRPIMPPTSSPARSCGSPTRSARVLREAVPARVSSQAPAPIDVAEQRQARDQHERSRREHQAHVEVAQQDHVSIEIRGPARGRAPTAPARRDGARQSARAAEAQRARALRRAREQRAGASGAVAVRGERGPRRRAAPAARAAGSAARPAGARQAREILVGIEIWHVAWATLQTQKSPAPGRRSRRWCPLDGLRRRRPVYPVSDFVTTL